ncbi:LysR family transcriptional regulator [Delftia acidovorans]|uniref:LysR family transcriptional regulator n=2 Tax=Comamonadaceae TaxID=80864 RepID=A0A7T2W076_DELAC|nr:LysR family transcriptional regulator [Delftia acidovorans]
MPKTMNLRQLQCFIVVAEELNFRRAAQRLHMTQPPLSRQIKALEDRLGTRLFDRRGRSTVLTAAGERFLDQARELMRHADGMVSAFLARAEQPMELRIGITMVIDAGLFSWIEPEFAARHPNIRLHVTRQTSVQSIQNLNAGTLDAAIIGMPSHTSGLTVEHLRDEPMVVGLSITHPAAMRQELALRDLSDDNLYWFDSKQNPAYHEHCERVFTRLKFNPPRTIEPPYYPVLLSLVADGRGIALFPSSLQSVKHDGVVYKALSEGEELGIWIGVAYRKGVQSEVVSAFVQFLKERKLAATPSLTCSP